MPFVESEIGPVTRFVLIALLIFVLASLIFYVVQGPPKAIVPAPPTQEHKTGGDRPQPRITNLRPRKEYGRRRCRDEGSRPLPGYSIFDLSVYIMGDNASADKGMAEMQATSIFAAFRWQEHTQNSAPR